MTALSIVDAIHERVGNGFLNLKKTLVTGTGNPDEKSHDEDDSEISNNDSTTASSVCNSVNGLDHYEKVGNGKLPNGLDNASVNGKAPSINGPIRNDESNGESNTNEANFFAFSLPDFHSLEPRTQGDFLLLAWALLVFRNTESGDDTSFTWTSSAAVEPLSRQTIILGETGNSPISKALDIIRATRNDPSDTSDELASDGLRMFFGTVGSSTEQNAKVLTMLRQFFEKFILTSLYSVISE